jgi:hypothetical protein
VTNNDVQVLMGHEKASTTLDLYVHRKQSLDSRVAGLFADFLLAPETQDAPEEKGEELRKAPELGKCGVGLPGLEPGTSSLSVRLMRRGRDVAGDREGRSVSAVVGR